MTIMLCISLVLAVSFVVIAMMRLKSIPESISALVYVFRWKWLWTLWLWLVALLTLIPCIEILSRIDMEFLGFGTLACLMFCGAVPLFMKDNVVMHWVCGVSGCILSQICVWFIGYGWLWAWLVWVVIFIYETMGLKSWSEWKTKAFWAEAVCYISLEGSLLSGG